MLLIVCDLFFGFSPTFLMPFYSYFLCQYTLPKYSLKIDQNTSVIFKKKAIFLILFLHVKKIPGNEKKLTNGLHMLLFSARASRYFKPGPVFPKVNSYDLEISK